MHSFNHEGKYGKVLRGHLLRSGTAVAVKLVNQPDQAHDANYELQLLHAIREAGPSAPTSLLRLTTHVTVGSTVVLCTQLCDAGNVAQAVRSTALSAAAAHVLARGLFAGLAWLHSKGWVHRDVKPANVGLRWIGSPVPRQVSEGTTSSTNRRAPALAKELSLPRSKRDSAPAMLHTSHPSATPGWTPVLLDYGLARPASMEQPLREAAGTWLWADPATLCRDACGTYQPADVWSAALTVLYGLLGFHPFALAGKDLAGTPDLIHSARVSASGLVARRMKSSTVTSLSGAPNTSGRLSWTAAAKNFALWPSRRSSEQVEHIAFDCLQEMRQHVAHDQPRFSPEATKAWMRELYKHPSALRELLHPSAPEEVDAEETLERLIAEGYIVSDVEDADMPAMAMTGRPWHLMSDELLMALWLPARKVARERFRRRWKHLTAPMQQLLLACTHRIPQQRPTAKQVLRSEWLHAALPLPAMLHVASSGKSPRADEAAILPNGSGRVVAAVQCDSGEPASGVLGRPASSLELEGQPSPASAHSQSLHAAHGRAATDADSCQSSTGAEPQCW